MKPRFTQSDIIEIIAACEKSSNVHTVEELTKLHGCNFGAILRVLEKHGKGDLAEDVRIDNKRSKKEAIEAHREKTREKKTNKAFELKTAVLDARKRKSFRLTLLCNNDEKKLIREKIYAVNVVLRKRAVSKFKKKIYELGYKDFEEIYKADDKDSLLNSTEMKYAFKEEQRANVSRLHFTKVKSIETPYIVTHQASKLVQEGEKFYLYINSLKKRFGIEVNEEYTEKNLSDVIREIYVEGKNRKDGMKAYLVKIFINQKGKVVGDLYDDQYFPDPYAKIESFIFVIPDSHSMRYVIKYFVGNDLVHESGSKNMGKAIQEIKDLESLKVRDKKNILTDDPDKYNEEIKKIEKKYSIIERNSRDGLMNGVGKIILDYVEKMNSRPVIIFPFTNFPIASEEKPAEWNYIQNRKMYIGVLKTLLTGKSWRENLEVIQLGEEDTNKYLTDMTPNSQFYDYAKELLQGEQHGREQEKENKKDNCLKGLESRRKKSSGSALNKEETPLETQDLSPGLRESVDNITSQMGCEPHS